MPKYTVYMQQVASTAITVEAEDTEDATEKAWDKAPGGLCAQCSGWGNPPGIDLSGDWEVYEVADEAGETVWVDRTEDHVYNKDLSK